MFIETQAQTTIRVSTKETDLILKTAPNGRLYQTYLGDRLLSESDIKELPYYLARPASDGAVKIRGFEAYPASGGEDFFEPAFAIQHNDGNLTSIPTYVSHQQKALDANITETVIELKDKVYPLNIKMFYVAYKKENVIKSWTEITHNEKNPVRISRYASNMLYFEDSKYFLTEFSGDWAKEVQISSQQLQFGKKVLETKLGSRAAMHSYPFFQLGLGQPVSETQGNVILGTIGWTGNFQFTFEVDNAGNLRVITGINPYASNYELKPNTVFKTPEFIFTLSNEGTGKASRNLHSWARNYQLKDGKGDRLTLLNNWEATQFDFDEAKLAKLMGEAKELGVDMFLLDDGWFGNKYPRVDDHAGLGDWQAMKSKLPNGVPGLVKLSKEADVKFGIWIEPEMVNPKSELYQKHPEWAIALPNRETYYYRNQLVLDLSNPKVQDYVFGVVDNLMKENPDLAFFKWDCNSPITNVYSPYLKANQEQLYIDHIHGIYNVFKRVKDKYPNIELMLCSGGGARCDYEALKYFSEFWPSDNTDPVERLYIQWGFSQFFPSKAMAAHVTSWNKTASIKFRIEVAMMEKLGFDISLEELKKDEIEFAKLAVANFKRLKKVIFDGNLYRLASPYESNHTSVMYVDDAQSKAVLYAYDIFPRFKEKLLKVKLQGLDALKQYQVKEINLLPGQASTLKENSKVYSGDYLMKVGLDAFTSDLMSSKVIEITVQ
ncbi:alpha-galactosidase [Flavobacterium sp. 1]|uniref:alpha-galactosidase n=1 Tax=Flavobacterium sp. 1 TaxID=2035200 RepID=UPI000CBB6419|nr:alpha-galactosidase [Flavobacterium sp. 1]PJJ07338.1 alpha-galactosidase [Flavobacterium sp. 1]